MNKKQRCKEIHRTEFSLLKKQVSRVLYKNRVKLDRQLRKREWGDELDEGQGRVDTIRDDQGSDQKAQWARCFQVCTEFYQISICDSLLFKLCCPEKKYSSGIFRTEKVTWRNETPSIPSTHPNKNMRGNSLWARRPMEPPPQLNHNIFRLITENRVGCI